jgi:hypothetical protein
MRDRITPEQVTAAYAATGLRPVRGITLRADGACGCPMAALFLQAARPAAVYPSGREIYSWCLRQWGELYITAFVWGAARRRADQWQPQSLDVDGVKDGVSVADAVFPEPH